MNNALSWHDICLGLKIEMNSKAQACEFFPLLSSSREGEFVLAANARLQDIKETKW